MNINIKYFMASYNFMESGWNCWIRGNWLYYKKCIEIEQFVQ